MQRVKNSGIAALFFRVIGIGVFILLVLVLVSSPTPGDWLQNLKDSTMKLILSNDDNDHIVSFIVEQRPSRGVVSVNYNINGIEFVALTQDGRATRTHKTSRVTSVIVHVYQERDANLTCSLRIDGAEVSRMSRNDAGSIRCRYDHVKK